MKVRKKILSVFFIIVIIFGVYTWFISGREETIIENDKYFRIIDAGEGRYLYTIYNTDGKAVKNGESYRVEPLIHYVDQKTIQILISEGTDAFYCVYYDIDNDRFSEQYDSSIAAKNNKVAFLRCYDAKMMQVYIKIISG